MTHITRIWKERKKREAKQEKKFIFKMYCENCLKKLFRRIFAWFTGQHERNIKEIK